MDPRIAEALAHDLVLQVLEAHPAAAERRALDGEEADTEETVAPDARGLDAAVEHAGDDQRVVGVEPVGELVVAGREERGGGVGARGRGAAR